MPDLPDFGFAPPPFDAANALQQLQRSLRELKLSPRGAAFELRGRCVLELAQQGAAIHARVARKPALTPEFDRFVIGDAPAQRKLLDEVKRRLARWAQDD
jgi:hypothetical protein